MTISKERFEQLALEVAQDMLRNEVMAKQYGINRTVALHFAHALIKRVEAESVVANNIIPALTDYESSEDWINASCTKLIALPLVSGD